MYSRAAAGSSSTNSTRSFSAIRATIPRSTPGPPPNSRIFASKLFCNGVCASPSDDFNCSNNSRCLASSAVGVSTISRTCASPRASGACPRPCRAAETAFPTACPAGTRMSTAPSSVGTLMTAPSVACAIEHRHLAGHDAALALEDRMRPHADDDVQIARRPAALPGSPCPATRRVAPSSVSARDRDGGTRAPSRRCRRPCTPRTDRR